MKAMEKFGFALFITGCFGVIVSTLDQTISVILPVIFVLIGSIVFITSD